jgi:hypothetical protein
MTYKINKFELGLYGFDTVFITVDKIEYQVPVKKGLLKGDEVEIVVNALDKPIEEIVTASTK